MNKKKIFIDTIDYLGLFFLGSFSVGYSILNRSFAQIHLELPFLDFPVFIGELLFAVCLLLFILKAVLGGIKIGEKKDLLFWGGIGLYVVFVLAKALSGYKHFGPLAFRNAALFYYPLFAVFAASFFNSKFFNKITIPLMLVFLMGSLLIRFLNCYAYFIFTYGLLALLLIMHFKSLALRIGLSGVLLFFSPFLFFCRNARADLIGSLAGAFVLVAFFLITKMRHAKVQNGIILAVFICLMVFSVKTFAKKEDVKSFTNIKNSIKSFQYANKRIAEGKRNYTPEKISVQVYQQDESIGFFRPRQKKIKSDVLVTAQASPTPVEPAPQPVAAPSLTLPAAPVAVIPLPEVVLDNEPVNNAIWRLLIWQEMLENVWLINPVWGVDFGKPFRSASIEILGWNRLEIRGVGWLEPHNSYVHIIYRAGLLGVLFILSFLTAFVQIVIRFARNKSTPGIFLVSILTYWLIAANFLVCFELPFFAIPFWSLFGLIYAYSIQLKPRLSDVK